MEYLDFEVEIGPGAGGEHTVTVLRSPAGEATESIRFALDSLALENRLQALQIALLRSSGTWRRVDSVEGEAVQKLGNELWASLFAGEVLGRLQTSRNLARQREMGLRVKLRISSPELAALPWEYLYDPAQADYLSLSTSTPLVRYIPLPQAMEPLTVRLPLRILAMAVTSDDLPGLDVERERERLDRAIAPLRERGIVELTWLDGRTWRDLQRALRREQWHIFHFIGHGGFDAVHREGLIVLADEQGKSHRLSATDLGRLLGDHEPLRLAVLNSCDSARADRLDVFSSTATTLVRRGTPAVVAMQYEITDDAAIEFSRSFYEAVADGMAVDGAMAEARKGVALAIPNTLAPDGVLFKLSGRRRRRASPSSVVATSAVPVVPPTDAVEAAERERLAEEAKRERAVAEGDERERLAAEATEAAERDRVAAEAAEAAERDRLAAEAAERDRVAAEATERDRLAAEASERDRVAAEAAEAAERDRLAAAAAAQAERERLILDTAERDRLAAEETRELRRRLEDLEFQRSEERRRADEERARQEATAATTPRPSRSPAPQPSPAKTKRGGGTAVAIVVALAVVLAAVGGLYAFTRGGTRASPTPRPSSAVPAAPSVAPPSVAIDPDEAVLLPDVYQMSEKEAIDVLNKAGFMNVAPGPVCSGSVPGGLVRQVVVNDGAPVGKETILVDSKGPVQAVSRSTPLFMKISTGKSCS